MMAILTGAFTMGCTEEIGECFDDELPIQYGTDKKISLSNGEVILYKFPKGKKLKSKLKFKFKNTLKF